MSNTSWSWRYSTFLKNFNNLLMGGGGGHDEKLKIFANRKKIIDLYELDNSKKKIFFEKKNFKVDSKCHFSSDFEQK